MIPISESVRVRRTPWITGTLVAACALTFLYELSLPPRTLDLFIQQWGANPNLVLRALYGDPLVPRTELLTLFTSQFLHGGWLHLIGNMVFLWVFGRAVEDRYGHFTYLALYLMGGAGAGIVQSWMNGSQPTLALIGASGAIATVLGAYLVSFPTAWVRVLVPIAVFFWWTFDIPAVLMLAFWFFGQFFTGVASITSAAAAGDVAVWAHVGGFVLGVIGGIAVPPAVPKAGWAIPSNRRRDGPGPAGLVSSIADLAALALGARILLHLLEVPASSHALLGQIAALAYGVTNPIVMPLEKFVPWLVVGGLPFDLPAVVAMVMIYLAAGAVVQALAGGPKRASNRRGYE